MDIERELDKKKENHRRIRKKSGIQKCEKTTKRRKKTTIWKDYEKNHCLHGKTELVTQDFQTTALLAVPPILVRFNEN